jgi:anti-sigma B factor antagonist
MEIATETTEGAQIVRVSEDVKGLDALSLSKALGELKDLPTKRVILDLTAVRFIDSNGLGGLIASYHLLRKHEKELVLAGPREQVKRLFRDVSFEKVFTLIDTP